MPDSELIGRVIEPSLRQALGSVNLTGIAHHQPHCRVYFTPHGL